MDDEINTTIKHKILKFSDRYIKKIGFCNYVIEEIQKGDKNNGYLGNIIKLRIVIKDGLTQTVPLDIVIKFASSNISVRAQIPIANVFNREIYMYNTVLRIFEDFEKQKNLVPSVFVPQFYESDTTDGEEMLILENLSTKGFKLYDQKIPMDHEHVSLILTTLGRLHAISFAIKDQLPKTFEAFYETMSDNFQSFLRKSNFDNYIISSWNKCLKILSLKLSKEHINVCQRFAEEIPQLIDEMCGAVDEHCVIIHGDPRTNNCMFKYDESTTKPRDVRMFDLQISRLASPAIDLSYFIYLCTSKEIMDQLDDYLELYHKSLSLHLEKLGNDAEKLFPFSVLQEQWKKYARFGLMMSVAFLPIILFDVDETPDIKEDVNNGKSMTDAFMENIPDTCFLNEIFMHIITHFITNKFIE